MEKHRLRVFGNMMLKKIFGSKKEDITGVARKLRGQELHDLHSSPGN
jgi:hypothetical protein